MTASWCGESDQEVLVDETFDVPGAKQALRIERVTTERAEDGSTVRLHAHELHFLRSDNETGVEQLRRLPAPAVVHPASSPASSSMMVSGMSKLA